MSADDDALEDALFAAWAEANVIAESPPAAARARLLDALSGAGRFQPLLAALGRLTDLGADALSAVLSRIDQAASWTEGAPGVSYFHFTPGPGAPAPAAGIVRVRPGAVFPRHRHLGPEVGFVLDGVLVENGQRHAAGSVIESAVGSEHEFAAAPGRDLLIVSLHGGIVFADPNAFRLIPPG
ncbi:MAG TPA: cupin domain-containing protein [Polyangia bacterium]|nr:cupin domain-containing protein [Polyangia bacterium]